MPHRSIWPALRASAGRTLPEAFGPVRPRSPPDQLAKLDAGSWIDPARGRMTFAALAEEWQASRGHLAVRSQETTRFLLDKYVTPAVGAYTT